MGDSQDFFQHLYDSCTQKGLIRELNEPDSPLAQRLMRHVREGGLDEALAALAKETDVPEDLHNEAIQLGSRYFSLMKDREKGILDTRDYTVNYNRIIDAILGLIRMLP